MKTRQAFYLHTTKLTRIARRLCREILRPWHAARHPYMPINSAAIKAECECRPPGPSPGLCRCRRGSPVWWGEGPPGCWPRLPLRVRAPPTGTARLPEASQSPLVLKQAVRKPLEAVLRYLGEPVPPQHRVTACSWAPSRGGATLHAATTRERAQSRACCSGPWPAPLWYLAPCRACRALWGLSCRGPCLPTPNPATSVLL